MPETFRPEEGESQEAEAARRKLIGPRDDRFYWYWLNDPVFKPRETNLWHYRYYDSPEGVHMVGKWASLQRKTIPVAFLMTFVEGAHAKILKNPRKMGNLFGKFAFVSMYGSMVFVTGAGLTSNIRDNISDRMNYVWPAPAAGAVLGMTLHRLSYGIIGSIAFSAAAYLCFTEPKPGILMSGKPCLFTPN